MEFDGFFSSSVLSKLMRKPRPKDQTRAVELPEDVVFGKILPRMPAKTLMRFKCVCKRWRDIISNDPDFISAHLRHPSEASQPSIVFVGQYVRKAQKKFQLLMLSESKVMVSDIPSMSPIQSCNIVGSSNGLICLHLVFAEGCTLVLWNPATKEVRDIGVPEDSPEPLTRKTHQGFCFDDEKRDYKVVRVVMENFADHDGLCFINVQVYSTSRSSWRQLGTKRFSRLELSGLVESSTAMQLGGSLHWLATRDVEPLASGNRQHRVVSYVLRDEELRFVDVPSGPDDNLSSFRHRYQLTRFRDSLCLISSQVHRHSAEAYHTQIWLTNGQLPAAASIHRGSVDHLSVWTSEPWCFVHDGYWILTGLWMDQFVMQVKWTLHGDSKLSSFDPIMTANSICNLDGFNSVDDDSLRDLMSVEKSLFLREVHHEYVPSLVTAYKPGEKRETTMVQLRQKRKIGPFRKILGSSKKWFLRLLN